MSPRYDVALADVMPSSARRRDGRKLAMMRWGLVPYWAKDLSIAAKQIEVLPVRWTPS